MPRPQRSPIALFALSKFKQSFGDLLISDASITYFARFLIEGTFENILWFGRTQKEYQHFERTTRAAYHFLQEGNKKKPKEIAIKYSLISNNIFDALNSSILALNEAQKVPSKDADKQIKRYLESYKVMYEGLLRLICAPIIYAFGIAKHVKDKAFIPDENGKISLNALKVMEKKFVYSDNRLAIGLNSHIRNAFSHQSYRILDGARVELWDSNPHRPKQIWGPEIWPLEKLIDLNNQLWINALGITCSLIIYEINNRRIMTDRGWVEYKQPPRPRREELENTVDTIADKVGFYMKGLIVSDKKVSMTLLPKSKGIDQDGTLYQGYKDHTSMFKIPLWYEEKRIIDQLTRMLFILMPYFETDSEVSFNIVSNDNKPLGLLSVDLPNIIGLNLADTDPETVNKMRHVYKIDTIGETITYIENKGAPRFAGIGPAVPKPGTSDNQ